MIPQVFSAEEIAEIDRQLDTFVADIASTLEAGDIFYEPDGKSIKSMFRLDQRSAFFNDLRLDARMQTIVDAIYPGENVAAQYTTFFGKTAGDGTAVPQHQDNGFNFWSPPHALNFSIALDPHTLENGVMHCCRGSHKMGVQMHKPSGVPGFSQMIAEECDQSLYPAVPCLMQPGDVTLHHCDTVHFSGGNTSSQSRRMFTTGFRGPNAIRDEAKWEAIQAERMRLHGRLSKEAAS